MHLVSTNDVSYVSSVLYIPSMQYTLYTHYYYSECASCLVVYIQKDIESQAIELHPPMVIVAMAGGVDSCLSLGLRTPQQLLFYNKYLLHCVYRTVYSLLTI